jgi:hypothetical protein
MKPVSVATGLLLVALCGGLSVAGAAAEDGVAITGEPALRMLFVDQTFYGHTREGTAWTEYYWPDGRSSYKQDDCITPGHWRASETGACFAYPSFENGEVSCYLLFRSNDQIDFVPDGGGDPDAEFIAETIKAGNAGGLPATAGGNCGG